MRSIIVLLLLSTSIYSQEADKPKEPESIINNFKMAMALTDPSADQIDSILQQSYRWLFNDQDSCLILAERAVEFTKKKFADQEIHAKALLMLGDAYRIRAELEDAEKLYFEGRALYDSLGVGGKVANANNKLGALNKERSEYEKAIEYYLIASERWEAEKDSANIFKPYINMSEVFYLLERKDKALEYVEKALEIANIKNYKGVRMICLANIAILQKEKAEEFRAMADTSKSNTQEFQDSAQVYFQKSLQKNEIALDIAKNGNNKRRTASFLGQITDLKLAMGDYDEAVKFGEQSEKLALELGSKALDMQSKVYLTRAYRKVGQLNKAIRTGLAGLAISDDESVSLERSKINEELYYAYKAVGRRNKALGYYEEYIDFKEESQSLERNELIADMETRYQTVQKEKQILEQQNNILELEESKSKMVRQRNYMLGGALGLGLFGFLGMQLNRVRRERNDKKAFAEALIYAQEEERKRIARELHDGVGQSLLLIKKQLESTHETTLENQQMISETLEEVRSISRDLHPFQLEKFGLTSAISDMLEKISRSTEIFVTKDIEKVDDLLTEQAEINVYRTIQEALNNIIKHSEATATKVSISAANNEMKVTIQDNGKGFDHELAVVNSKSLGLRTMAERISSIGGNLKIEQGSPKGTVIKFDIPISIQKQN